MLQKPKLKDIMANGVPSTPKQAMTFLGAVAFLRRMVPRISLLAAPMTHAIKQFEKRHQSTRGKSNRPQGGQFNDDEFEYVKQSWHAILDHLDDSAVLAAPDFEDPLAHFVICTDASDYAVGGVLMQWQHPHPQGGPGPPPGVPTREVGKTQATDPLDSKWRKDAGWELKVIGYYSKTLIDAQKNYPAFDKEAGAALLCCRHWADLITYHPTTLYTDSAVATSMLTKHIAPPRLQRWGAELGSFLPHLRISYRKGADNGLADLLSRYQAFKRFTTAQDEDDAVELPDDYFDYVGEAPLYHRIRSTRDRAYLAKSAYQLYEPKTRQEAPSAFWLPSGGPVIPGRGLKDRVSHNPAESTGTTSAPGDDTGGTALLPASVLMAAAESAECSSHGAALRNQLDAVRESITGLWDVAEPTGPSAPVLTFQATLDRPPCIELLASDSCDHDALLCAVVDSGCSVAGPDDVPDMRIRVVGCEDGESHPHEVVLCAPDDTPRDIVRVGCRAYSISGPLAPHLPHSDSHARHPATDKARLQSMIAGSCKELLHVWFDFPRDDNSSCVHALMSEHWANHGYGSSPVQYRLDVEPPLPPSTAGSVFGVEAADTDTDEPATAQATRHRSRRHDWQESSQEAAQGDDEAEPLPWSETTAPITRAEQLRDPQVRILFDALEGSSRLPRAHRARVADRYELVDEVLHRVVLNDGEPCHAVVVPRHMRAAVLARFHYSLADGGGHSGGQTMYDQIRVGHFWADMERECHEFTAACLTCGGTRSQGTIGAEPGVSPTPSAPFQVIHVDHKGPLPMSGGFAHVLVVVCALTRFTLYIPVKDTTGATTLQALKDRVFSVFGYPLVIISDNGSAFANKLIKASERLYGFRQVFVMPHTPQANGLAETAVKKLKLILDRHTTDYCNWHPLCSMAQSAVNQRVSGGSMETPFAALFGRRPVTLTALENPALLPVNSPEEKSVRDLAFTMSRLHRRLQEEVDNIKDAAAENSKRPSRPRRQVQRGDKVWLIYSDSERARYLRKHGHGVAWRHPFIVDAVKPHAVKLIVPKDGSVPEVQPWQSLRKCSFAAPHFHHHEMPVPTVDDTGVPVIRDPDAPTAATVPQLADAPLPPADDPDDPYATWTDKRTYDVERIVGAEQLPNRGWLISVKWKGFHDDHITPEPLHKLLKTITDPGILQQINDAKADHLASRPAQSTFVRPEPPVAKPLRHQPHRAARDEGHRTVYQISRADDDAAVTRHTCGGLLNLRDRISRRVLALTAFVPDFQDCVLTLVPAP